MIKTILFDLDGTLLPLDMDSFLSRYFDALGNRFKDYFKKEELANLVWASTKYMIQNTEPHKTNEDAFFEDFLKRVVHPKTELHPIFDDFYINNFIEVKEAVGQSQWIIKSIEALREKGYQLVVATNPIFPYEAVRQRIEWAGLKDSDFDLITSFEKMHFCKPHLQFYEEVLALINRKPNECMMVGNDVEEDMISKHLGLQTYLIEDHKISRGREDNVDDRGSYEDFYRFVLALPSIK